MTQLNTQLKPALDAMSNAYQDIFTLDDNGNEIFSPDIDFDNLQPIHDYIEEIQNAGGSIDSSSFEHF